MQKIKYLIYSLIVLVICSCSIAEAQPVGIIKFTQKASSEEIEINVPKLEGRKVFTVPSPDRLVVDVPSVAGKPNVSLPSDYNGKLIKAARFGQFNPKTSRFVFDLKKAVRVVSTDVVANKLKIVIDDKAKDSKESANTKETKDKKEVKKSPEPTVSKKTAEPKSYKRKSSGPPLIVIDPGHGGIDPGATGVNGTQEKDVVLEYSLALKAKLVKLKKYRVRLTRHDDQFISLRERVAIARRAGASLFLSIHADSAEGGGARGLSVYTVSENASDKEAELLAARENKSDIIAGMDLSEERAEVADILISLAQRETKNNSATFADYLVLALGNKVNLLPNSHRFAGFAVLKAPDIPSVLIEIGFLSNPQEEKQIKTKSHRDKVIEGIIAGIEDYFRKKSSSGEDL